MALICSAADTQAERIALTEPDTLRDIQPVRALLQMTVFLAEKVGICLLWLCFLDLARIFRRGAAEIELGLSNSLQSETALMLGQRGFSAASK